jgi:vacuolar-type H+-ATPase subunit F/Vma7
MADKVFLENPLAIIADSDLACGFTALGFKPYILGKGNTFEQLIADIIKQNIAVCLVEAGPYHANKAILDNYKNLALPIFIPFSKNAETDLLDKILKDIKLRATGVVQ